MVHEDLKGLQTLGSRIVRLITFVFLLFLPLIAGFYAYTEWFGRRAHPRPADVIIVLGAAVWPQGPSPALRERLLLAADLYRQGYAPVIITTGGVGEYNPTPEGKAGKELLQTWGIPEKALYAETSSHNTRENLLGARAIMQVHGWRRAIIVTHDFHLWRALREARELGIDASGAGVKKTVLVRPPLVLREAVANLVELVHTAVSQHLARLCFWKSCWQLTSSLGFNCEPGKPNS